MSTSASQAPGEARENARPARGGAFGVSGQHTLVGDSQFTARAARNDVDRHPRELGRVFRNAETEHQPAWPVDLQIVAHMLGQSVGALFSDDKLATHPGIDLNSNHLTGRGREKPAARRRRIQPAGANALTFWG